MTPSLPAGPLLAALTVIDDLAPHPAGLNMALDEVLLATLGGSDGAILRCYRWSEPAVSFGCFGRVADARRDHPGLPLVRRWTGGGIVEHGDDFTWTLLASRHQPLAAARARDCYRLVHSAVAEALSLAGLAQTEAAPPASTLEAPFLKPCFAHPVADDLLAKGRKVAGGAQRRTRNGLLHQGSIQGVFEAGGPDEATRRTLTRVLAAALGNHVTFRGIAPEELAAAVELAVRKYGSRTWTDRF